MIFKPPLSKAVARQARVCTCCGSGSQPNPTASSVVNDTEAGTLGTFPPQMDLNKTEEVISKLEKLHQQPHIWKFLFLLPRLYANNVRVEDRLRGGAYLLQAALK